MVCSGGMGVEWSTKDWYEAFVLHVDECHTAT